VQLLGENHLWWWGDCGVQWLRSTFTGGLQLRSASRSGCVVRLSGGPRGAASSSTDCETGLGGWGGQPPHLLRPQSEFRDLAVHLWGAQMERTAQAVCSAVAGQVRLGGALTGAAERTARLLGALLVGPRCAVGSVRVGSDGAHSESCVIRSGRATAAQIAACGSDDWERACKGRSVRIPCYCAIPAVVIQCSRTIGRDSGGELCTRSDAVSAVFRRCQSFAMGTSTAEGRDRLIRGVCTICAWRQVSMKVVCNSGVGTCCIALEPRLGRNSWAYLKGRPQRSRLRLT